MSHRKSSVRGEKMSITLEELKHIIHLVGGNKKIAPIGTLLYRMGHPEENADPVTDVREIRLED